MQEVVHEAGTRVELRVEDFGASPLATRFGIKEYPAVFVDDALVARPEEFVAWGGGKGGKYVPWSKLENRLAFQADLRRMVRLRLAGGVLPMATAAGQAEVERVPLQMPSMQLRGLDGSPFTFASLAGKPLVIELWASWCPPCLQTLRWLQTLDPATVNVVAVAVESPVGDVRKLAVEMRLSRAVIGTPELVEALGGLSAIPTLLVVDRHGKLVRSFYGAPPDLHDQVRAELAKLR